MAIKKNLKDRPEESFWKPVFSADMMFRIKGIVEQTGLSPTDLFLKWIFQEESLIGLMQASKDPTSQQAEARPSVTKSAEAVLPGPGDQNYRKMLIKRALKLKKQGMSLKKIAETFNDENISTLSGTGKWYASTIINLLKPKK